MSQPTPSNNKTLADGNRQDKHNKRKPVEKPYRPSRNVKLGNVLTRFVKISEALEHQLQRNGFQVEDFTAAKKIANAYIDVLLVKGGELPEDYLQPTDEALEKLLEVSNRNPTLVSTAVPQQPTFLPLEPTTNRQLNDGKSVSPSGYMDRGFDCGDDDRGFDPSIADWIADEDPATNEGVTTNPILLDQNDSANSSTEDDSEARRGKKKSKSFNYDKYGINQEDEGTVDSWSASGAEPNRALDPGPSRTRPIDDRKDRKDYTKAKVRPARPSMVAYFGSVGGTDDVTADWKRTSVTRFITPRAFSQRTTKDWAKDDPNHEDNFEWVLDAIYDVARESMFRRNRFDNAARDRYVERENEWALFEQKVLGAWENKHSRRWGDRDKWTHPETCQVGHALPRFFARPDALQELEVRYFTEFGNDLESIKPFAGYHRPNTYPIAFNPFARLHVRTPEGNLIWVHPNENSRARDHFMDNQNDKAFWTFAKIQTRNHPIHRATLVRVDNFGEILAGLFRFLAYYRVDFVSGEGVLFRQDARILWSQTSECWKIGPEIFRPPTLIFRIGFFHYAWWESRLGSNNLQGTARLYCLEADRWLGAFGAVGNSLSSDFTRRTETKRHE